MKEKYKFTYRVKTLEEGTGNVEVPAGDLFSARDRAKGIVQHHYKTRGVTLPIDAIELTALAIPVPNA